MLHGTVHRIKKNLIVMLRQFKKIKSPGHLINIIK